MHVVPRVGERLNRMQNWLDLTVTGNSKMSGAFTQQAGAIPRRPYPDRHTAQDPRRPYTGREDGKGFANIVMGCAGAWATAALGVAIRRVRER
jgi:hypothetical protein